MKLLEASCSLVLFVSGPLDNDSGDLALLRIGLLDDLALS